MKPPLVVAFFSHDGSNEYQSPDFWDTGLAGADYDVYSPWANVSNSGVPAAAQIVGRFRIANEPGGNPQWTDIHESHLEYQWV
jgi:hypothetical protein